MSSTPTSHEPHLAEDHRDVQGQLQHLEDQFHSLQRQLWHAQRLASLGTMAAIVAHEYNNLMTLIVSFAKYALEQGDSELMRSALEKILNQVDRVRHLSDRVLHFAADQDKGPTTTSLRTLIEESLECLGRDLAKDNIGLTLEVSPTIRVRVRPGPMQQVFVNLIQNARQAMIGRRGRLTISAEQEGSQVRVRVSDTGCGIRTEDLPRVFEPFFTTKGHADRPDKRGIGLGLAICRDIVTSHGGRIELESRFGHGTTFTLFLPAAE